MEKTDPSFDTTTTIEAAPEQGWQRQRTTAELLGFVARREELVFFDDFD